MILSVTDPAVQAVLNEAVVEDGRLFPSPDDWRSQWIYFLMVDRFYPLFYHLPAVVKGLPGEAPADVAEVFQQRDKIH
jgi:hypothetical protein